MHNHQTPETIGFQKHLSQLRNALLDLHKALVDSERAGYEQSIGPITSATQFLRLLTDDPWFVWLQPLSKLIVSMDEALDAPASVERGCAETLIKSTAALLVATETGTGFPRHYYDALQRDPDVLMAHADAARLFRSKPKPPTPEAPPLQQG